MIVIDNVIDSYEIIPFSKDFSKDDYSYKENRRTYDSPLTIDTARSERSERSERSFHKKDSNSWSEPATTISTEFKGESNHEFNLLKKELKLLKQELTLKDREFGHDIKESICEINELKYKFEEISKENDLNKNKLSIQKETLVNEIRENIDLVDKTVVSQFLSTYL